MNILEEITAERARQDEKFGPQSHPSILDMPPKSLSSYYEIPLEQRAKDNCELAFSNNEGTWADIALEEFAEVVFAPDEASRRTELVQLAAVCVAWIEDLDRKNAKK